jgi:hypothetical protein
MRVCVCVCVSVCVCAYYNEVSFLNRGSFLMLCIHLCACVCFIAEVVAASRIIPHPNAGPTSKL